MKIILRNKTELPQKLYKKKSQREIKQLHEETAIHLPCRADWSSDDAPVL